MASNKTQKKDKGLTDEELVAKYGKLKSVNFEKVVKKALKSGQSK